MRGMFYSCEKLLGIINSKINTKEVKDISIIFCSFNKLNDIT